MNERRPHLVAYDIRDPARLKRVHDALADIGYHLQYSVFAVDLDDRARARLVARLRRLIHEREDDVRFYLVPEAPRGRWHGPLPGGDAISVSGAPAARIAAFLARQQGD